VTPFDAVIIGILSASTTITGVGVYILYGLHVRSQSAVRAFTSFVAPNGDQPSDMAVLWDAMVERTVGKMGMAQLGRSSGQARSEKSAEIDYIKAMVANERPEIAAVLDQVFPKWGKMMAQYPQIVPKMMEYIGNKSPVDPKATNGVQHKFNLSGD